MDSSDAPELGLLAAGIGGRNRFTHGPPELSPNAVKKCTGANEMSAGRPWAPTCHGRDVEVRDRYPSLKVHRVLFVAKHPRVCRIFLRQTGKLAQNMQQPQIQ
jgi:hypothetical protein